MLLQMADRFFYFCACSLFDFLCFCRLSSDLQWYFLKTLICKNGNTLIRSQGRTLLGYNKRYKKLVKENWLVTSPLTGTTLLESGLNTGWCWKVSSAFSNMSQYPLRITREGLWRISHMLVVAHCVPLCQLPPKQLLHIVVQSLS